MASAPKYHTDALYAPTRELLRRIGVVDLHVDSIIQQRLFGYDVLRKHRPLMWGQPFIWQADVPRMLEAGYRGAVMGIHFYPWESEKGWAEINRQIDYLDWFAEVSPECLRALSPVDWHRAQVRGKLAVAPGVEGLHCINGKLERLETLARRGVAVLTLAHFGDNAFCCSSFTSKTADRGLTGLGREAVQELNRLGIAIDVAHVHKETLLETCKLTTAPVLCTHTGLVAQNEHRRNIDDEEIDAIAATGGGIAIMQCPAFVAGRDRIPDSRPMVECMERLAQRAGIRHIVTGTDYDGWMSSIPGDQKDCRDLVKVAQMLLERGYGEDALTAIFGENTRRIFREVRASAHPDHSLPPGPRRGQ